MNPRVRGTADAEFLADALVHAAGLVLATVGAVIMVLRAARDDGAAALPSIAVYLGGLFAMLGCSAVYNVWHRSPYRALLRRLDHAAIFVMIAGTYTPLSVLALPEPWRTRLMVLVWTAAVAGVVLKLWQPRRVETVSVVLYLLLGWIGVIALEAFVAAMDAAVLALIVAGGLTYSGGVVVHLSRRLRHRQALWHGCVLAGAALHYFAILGVLRR